MHIFTLTALRLRRSLTTTLHIVPITLQPSSGLTTIITGILLTLSAYLNINKNRLDTHVNTM